MIKEQVAKLEKRVEKIEKKLANPWRETYPWAHNYAEMGKCGYGGMCNLSTGAIPDHVTLEDCAKCMERCYDKSTGRTE